MTALHQFLLATAREEWEPWYNVTRLVFADWLEEGPRYDNARAAALRAAAVEIAHVIPAGSLRPNRIDVLAVDADGNAGMLVEYEVGDSWLCGDNLCFSLRDGLRYHIASTLPGQRLRLRLADWPGVTLPYQITCTGGNRWHGTFSLDRARRDCRRRVLALFADEDVELELRDLLAIPPGGVVRFADGTTLTAPRHLHEGQGQAFTLNPGTKNFLLRAPQLIPPEAEPSPPNPATLV